MSLRSFFSRARPSDADPTAATASPLSGECHALAAAYNALGWDVLERLVAADSRKNCLISPLSIAVCLMMVQVGAARETRNEMTQLLRVGDLSEAAIDQATPLFLASLRAPNEIELRVANSLWVNKNIQLAAPFARRCQQIFEARASSLDFAAPASVARINDWVSAATHGKIDRIVEKLEPLDFLFLINAVYFRGDWLDPFEKRNTKAETFHAPSGATPVEMMNRRAHFRYLENAVCQMVALPYGGKRFALYLLLPRPNSSVAAVLQRIRPNDLNSDITKMQRCEGRVSLPRFKMNYDVDLSKCLQALGMREAFDERRADFSPMSAEPLFVGAVIHKTVFDLDETGTEAAAVTAAKIVGSMAPATPPQPFEFIANHPFALILRDDWSGAWLFAGLLNAPSSD